MFNDAMQIFFCPNFF